MNDQKLKITHTLSSPTGYPVAAEVLIALKNSDATAFEQIYIQFHKPIYNFLLKLTGSKEDAEELAQVVFVNVWERRSQIDPSRNIKHYLYTIAKNSALKLIMRKKRLGGEALEKHQDHIPDRLEATSEMEAIEFRLLVSIALERMPEIRRQVFMLYDNGYDNRRIAKELNLSEQNAAQHLSRARKDIRNIFENSFN